MSHVTIFFIREFLAELRLIRCQKSDRHVELKQEFFSDFACTGQLTTA
jgi:hypothetical protein